MHAPSSASKLMSRSRPWAAAACAPCSICCACRRLRWIHLAVPPGIQLALSSSMRRNWNTSCSAACRAALLRRSELRWAASSRCDATKNLAISAAGSQPAGGPGGRVVGSRVQRGGQVDSVAQVGYHWWYPGGTPPSHGPALPPAASLQGPRRVGRHGRQGGMRVLCCTLLCCVGQQGTDLIRQFFHYFLPS